MVTDFLIKSFKKDSEAYEKSEVRSGYALLSGAVGVFVNILLFICKLCIGFISGAVSVIADAFNNLSDVASSLITIVGMRMAQRPADKEHPFGHGRIEYLTALFTSVMVLCVGLMLLYRSVRKLIRPEELNFSYIAVAVLLLSILGKAFLSAFDRRLGELIRSNALLAVAADARSDMLATAATVIALLCYKFFGMNIDGLMGMIVSCYVIKTGIEIAGDTLLPIIGAPASREEYEDLIEFIRSYDGVLGIHDLIVHSYGPSHSYATVHVEIPVEMSLNDSHVLLDAIEKAVKERFGVELVTHADPLDIHDERTAVVYEALRELIEAEDAEGLEFHDLRIINASGEPNAVFDLVVPWNYEKKDEDGIRDRITAGLNEKTGVSAVMTIEHSF